MNWLAAFLLAAPAFAQQEGQVKRGPFEVRVNVQGNVVAQDVYRLKSSIDGRIEAVLASTFSWSGPDSPLALVVDSQLAALIDSRQTTSTEILAKRWQEVYQPNRVRCPDECFVLAVFARPKKKVLPQALLFEAAGAVLLKGRVRPEDRHLIKEGQWVDFWPRSDPKFRQRVKIGMFILDVQGQKADSGGTFTARLDPKHYLDPGTDWAGSVLVGSKKAVLQVPTKALIQHQGSTYLPVRVSTGATTDEVTEIQAGIDEKRPILILDAPQLKGAEHHHRVVEPLPPPKSGTFIHDNHGGNRALDDSPRDRPAPEEEDD
ncbi:MAG: hypothetical protein HY553_00070 [Elusimicrobia bacterium]|nr:hypothetical protein [Elusimicrobiota bacterium]